MSSSPPFALPVLHLSESMTLSSDRFVNEHTLKEPVLRPWNDARDTRD